MGGSRDDFSLVLRSPGKASVAFNIKISGRLKRCREHTHYGNFGSYTSWCITLLLRRSHQTGLFTLEKIRLRVRRPDNIFFNYTVTLTDTLDEELIKYGLEEDVWFHVDKLSSAHIYLRMNEGESWETIPADLLNDCGQLTKANSIEGKKVNTIGEHDAEPSKGTKKTMLPSFTLRGQI